MNTITIQKEVKLNNPLMGTETDQERLPISSQPSQRVNLNNPLMGTETSSN